jgi:hypothetical protein
MRQLRTFTVPAHQEQRDVIHCDGCGRPSASSLDWDDEQNRLACTRIEMQVGDNYPEGASYVETSFDLCPDCFATKLVPALAALFGTGPHVEDKG